MNDGSLLEKVVGHMEEKLTGNELEMLYAAADYRRAEIVMNQYFDKGRCEQVPDMRSSYSSGAHPRGTS
ncbi:hypothetical protein G9H50_00005 [Klebsiella pneumoniae]|uniref:Hha/YmoA family nucleoid-associated regulatory protein n=1 Tax=Klebsiella pneumoniae TaxID=573 RepID=UPI001D21A71D|nr:Hha/YmoA family nucleoid-associated regulatory protein [Klebsiella pneumoniae]MBA1550745.1 hypothetical protein [Klebsiella pneumoniae]